MIFQSSANFLQKINSSESLTCGPHTSGSSSTSSAGEVSSTSSAGDHLQPRWCAGEGRGWAATMAAAGRPWGSGGAAAAAARGRIETAAASPGGGRRREGGGHTWWGQCRRRGWRGRNGGGETCGVGGGKNRQPNGVDLN